MLHSQVLIEHMTFLYTEFEKFLQSNLQEIYKKNGCEVKPVSKRAGQPLGSMHEQ